MVDYNEAKDKFLSGDVALVEQYFEENNYLLEWGYCKFLSGDLENAKIIFKHLKEQDLRADWAEKLIQFVEGHVLSMPTYFQIRNFLEIDLNLLITAKKPDFIENIINGGDLFYSVNQESYKFIARVMMHNDFYDVAFYFLKKAKDKFYYDPEMHLMLANCYIKNGDNYLARQSIENCLSILPNYLPAKMLLNTL